MAGQPSPRTQHFDNNAKAQPQSAQDCSMEEAFGLGLMNGPSPEHKTPSARSTAAARDTCRGEAPGLSNER